MRGPEIFVRNLSIPSVFDKSGTHWQYHSQSDQHSKVACWGIVLDLLRQSNVLAAHTASGEVAFGINHEMVDFRNGRKKNLDLVICEPRSDESRKKPRTVRSLVQQYRLDLSPEDTEALESVPDLVERPVGSVRIALEAKAAMTAHVRARPRLYDELTSSHATVHGAADHAIAVGLVIVNVGSSFVSPELNKALGTSKPVVSSHAQPGDAMRVIEKVAELPRRNRPEESGFDALGIIVIDFKNDGTPAGLVVNPPAPAASDPYNYEQMIRRVAALYDFRFGRT